MEGVFHFSSSHIIQPMDLPDLLDPYTEKEQYGLIKSTPPLNVSTLKENVDAYEQKLIKDQLQETPSHAEAARLLGISRQTLHNKLQKYGIV